MDAIAAARMIPGFEGTRTNNRNQPPAARPERRLLTGTSKAGATGLEPATSGVTGRRAVVVVVFTGDLRCEITCIWGDSGVEGCPGPLPGGQLPGPLPGSFFRPRQRVCWFAMTPNPSARPFIRQRATGPFWYAKWSRNGQPVIRALGRAWVESDGNGGWRRKRCRSPEGLLTEAEAAERMLALVREHDADQTMIERDAEERRRRGVTFRELAGEYLEWLEHVKGAKPSTLRDHRLVLAEPGQTYRRGTGTSRGLVMAALGERPAREVTTREIEDLLRSVSSTGVAARTVNKVRQLICAIFNYGLRPSTYGLASNPALYADRRREPDRGPLACYSPEQSRGACSCARSRCSSRSLPTGPEPRGNRGSRLRGRPGRRARSCRCLRRPPPRRACCTSVARRRLRRPQNHRPSCAVRRHRAPLHQEPSSP